MNRRCRTSAEHSQYKNGFNTLVHLFRLIYSLRFNNNFRRIIQIQIDFAISLAYRFAYLLCIVNISNGTTASMIMQKTKAFLLFVIKIPALNKLWFVKWANIIRWHAGARIYI